MPNGVKNAFLTALGQRFGVLRKLEGSRSLYEIGDGTLRVYIRYSKIHDRNQAFYGLRKRDLEQLQRHRSVICFLWEGQSEPLVIPYSHYEELLLNLPCAEDGQIKAAVYPHSPACELYLSNAGRFNVRDISGMARN